MWWYYYKQGQDQRLLLVSVLLKATDRNATIFQTSIKCCLCWQCHLDKEGATDLVVDLIINNHSSRIFLETVELGIALLEGGNTVIQVGLLSSLSLFYRVLIHYFRFYQLSFTIKLFQYFHPVSKHNFSSNCKIKWYGVKRLKKLWSCC